MLPPRISEEASVVAKKETSRSSKTVYLGCPELVMAESTFAACRKQEHLDTSTPKINTQR